MNEQVEYIERETAIRALCDATSHTCNYQDCGNGCAEAQTILLIPAADVQPTRHGKWIEHGEPDEWKRFQTWYWKCSKCGAVGIDEWNYCPNCGAMMSERG